MAKQSLDIDLTDDTQETHQTDLVIEDGKPVPLTKSDADVVDEDINPLDRLPDQAIQNDDGSVTLPLMFPQSLRIRKNGKERSEVYTELTFHRLTGADQRAISATSDGMMTVVAFARTTRISQAIMNVLYDKLDAADITAGGQVLNSFIATGRKTGR